MGGLQKTKLYTEKSRNTHQPKEISMGHLHSICTDSNAETQQKLAAGCTRQKDLNNLGCLYPAMDERKLKEKE